MRMCYFFERTENLIFTSKLFESLVTDIQLMSKTSKSAQCQQAAEQKAQKISVLSHISITNFLDDQSSEKQK